MRLVLMRVLNDKILQLVKLKRSKIHATVDAEIGKKESGPDRCYKTILHSWLMLQPTCILNSGEMAIV